MNTSDNPTPTNTPSETGNENAPESTSKIDTSSYKPPLDQLLSYSAVGPGEDFPELDYRQVFGIGPEHIPELIRMANDSQLTSEDANNFEFTATLHAVRALTQLRATEGIEGLLPLFEQGLAVGNEWMSETLPEFYVAIGQPALPALTRLLHDPAHSLYARSDAASAIASIVEEHPEMRAEGLAAITSVLEHPEQNEPDLNGFLIADLIKLKAVEAAPLIEKAFEAEEVDESIAGDWDEVKYQLGLGPRPERPVIITREMADLFKAVRGSGLAELDSDLDLDFDDPSTSSPALRNPSQSPSPSRSKEKSKKKSKTKMAKASKKKNRR